MLVVASCGGDDETRRAPVDPKDAAAETAGRGGSAGSSSGSSGTGGSVGSGGSGGSTGGIGGSGGSVPDASVDGTVGTAGSGGSGGDAGIDGSDAPADVDAADSATLGCIRAIQGEHYLRTDGRVYDFSGTPLVIEQEATGLPLENVIEIFEGDFHGCALKSDGTVWCWALTTDGNGAGQLGSGAVGGTTVVRHASQVRLGGPDAGSPPLTGAVHLNTGSSRSYLASTTCAILQDTSLWCWGAIGNGGGGNFFNDGVAGNRPYAVQILASASTPLTGVSQVGLGRRHACGFGAARFGAGAPTSTERSGSARRPGKSIRRESRYRGPLSRSASDRMAAARWFQAAFTVGV